MSDSNTNNTGFVLTGKWYNRAKWFILIFLPAFSALYSGAALLFGLMYVAQVVGGAGLLGVFLGTILGISNNNYNKQDHDGALDAEIIRGEGDEPDQVVFSSLRMPDIAPEDLATRKTVTLKVNADSSSQ